MFNLLCYSSATVGDKIKFRILFRSVAVKTVVFFFTVALYTVVTKRPTPFNGKKKVKLFSQFTDIF